MEGIENLIKTVVAGMFIILAYLGMSCSEVKAAEGTICTPELVEVCSICGHKYHNDGCPHMEGEIYGAEKCNPEDGRICNICGKDYSDYSQCQHYNGNEYGGIVCEPWDRCNICGEDYNDGSLCSHHRDQSYGGQVCEVYVIQLCNICNADYTNSSQCSHFEGLVYDKEYCEPVLTEMCNICGHKYYNDGCPHWDGEIYGGTVCAPVPTCNICYRPYENGGCPHWVDERYGGTVCEAYDGRICNICGYDYDDGNLCPHKIGQVYNDQLCGIEMVKYCNICGHKYHKDDCPHWEGEEYRNVAYYIYLPEFEERALTFKEVMKDLYNLDDSDVILIPVSDASELYEAWNNIGTVNGELVYTVTVVIETHGDNEKLCDKESKELLTEDMVEIFHSKHMERLILLGCNVGHLDNKDHNPAAFMSKLIYGAPVLASDGTVDVNKNDMEYTSSTSESFPDMCQNGTRDNQGWLKYTCKGGKIYVSGSLGKIFTVEGILKALDGVF